MYLPCLDLKCIDMDQAIEQRLLVRKVIVDTMSSTETTHNISIVGFMTAQIIHPLAKKGSVSQFVARPLVVTVSHFPRLSDADMVEFIEPANKQISSAKQPMIAIQGVREYSFLQSSSIPRS